jgi:amino acid permease
LSLRNFHRRSAKMESKEMKVEGTMSPELEKQETNTSYKEIDLSGGSQLERGLKSRHIQYVCGPIVHMHGTAH